MLPIYCTMLKISCLPSRCLHSLLPQSKLPMLLSGNLNCTLIFFGVITKCITNHLSTDAFCELLLIYLPCDAFFCPNKRYVMYFHFVWTDVCFRQSRRGAGVHAPVRDHRLNVRSGRRGVSCLRYVLFVSWRFQIKSNQITFNEHATNVHACSGREQMIRCSNVTEVLISFENS